MAEVKKPVSRKHRISQQFRNEYTVAYPVIRKSSVDCSHAFCTVCSADINISHGGIVDVKKHVDSTKHASKAKQDEGKKLSDFSIII